MSTEPQYSFLTIVPRGLEDVVTNSLQREARAASNETILQISCWNETQDQEIGRQAVQQLAAKEQAKEERRQRIQTKQKQGAGENESPQQTGNAEVDWVPPGISMGSVVLDSTGQHISVGYRTDGDGTVLTCWSCGGQMAGSVWMQLETSRQDVYRDVIFQSRCFGPLLALVTVQHDNDCLRNLESYYTHSIHDICSEITRHVQQPTTHFPERLHRALHTWKDCVQDQWKEQLTTSDFEALQERIRENRLRFRISCIRQQGIPGRAPDKKTDRSSDFAYARQDFCRALMDSCGDVLVPEYSDEEGSGKNGSWTISLDKFDVEVVVILLPNTMAVGISMRPYSFLKSKSFAYGIIPPDVTAPFLGGKTTEDVVKLKTTTAHSLLELADLKDGDVVLDPCAGVGTIPLEADQYFRSKNCVALGGDLALNNPDLTKVAKSLKSTDLVAVWDASFLPVRTASVDVIVSDLPFGHQCLSHSSLCQLLPLLYSECARTLNPGSGRMVLLCGGTPNNHFDDLHRWSGEYWQRPVRRASPVNIGGLLVWIIRVDRNDQKFSHENHDGELCYLDRVRKLTRKRDYKGRHRKNQTVEQKNGKRRRRARG